MDNYPGYNLHQIGPYIGKIRPLLARQLVSEYSSAGDWIWDPFCGSGTIPLECRLLSRNVIAADINPYANILTKAKLQAPISETHSFKQIDSVAISLNSLNKELYDIPEEVRAFFHEKTLMETMALMDEFILKKQFFIVGCLLGILHHQRPGFLSYPACHLVPYLRNKLYPKEAFPELYMYRDPIPRLKAKIKRVLKYPPPSSPIKYKVYQKSACEKYLTDSSVDAVITSPPYMDVLDYAKDNRLRLWFLGSKDYKCIRDKEIRKISTFKQDMIIPLQIISKTIKPGGACIIILGDLMRDKRKYDIAEMIVELIKSDITDLSLELNWTENMPDLRRSRRNGRATKCETILVFRSTKGDNHGKSD